MNRPLADLLRKCAEHDEAHGITAADRRHHLGESDRRVAMWNAMTPDERDRILRCARPDVRRDLTVPTIAVVATITVILAVGVIVGV